MDQGNYNCRDYYISPHISPITIATETSRPQCFRHESWQEMEERCRSPASKKPKFPLLCLPLELRQEILSYLLPRTRELLESNPLGSHARNFSAVQKRVARGMVLPEAPTTKGINSSARPKPPGRYEDRVSGRPAAQVSTNMISIPSNVVWQRGNINILPVCRQLHDECAEMIYGTNTFLLFVTFNGITFRFRWLLPSGLAPSASKGFLELLPPKYLQLIKRVVIHIDHVDSYTGQIKFNVGGKGLTHGLRRQVQRLVTALKPPDPLTDRRLTKINIRISNGNAVIDALKSDPRQRDAGYRVSDDVETMLEPFKQLYGVREVSVSGAVTVLFARELEAAMTSTDPPPEVQIGNVDADGDVFGTPVAGLCVYGNDIS